MYKLFERIIYKSNYFVKHKFLKISIPYINVRANHLTAYKCYKNKIEHIETVDNLSDIRISENVLQKPGHIKVENQIFDLRKDGVYRFYRLPNFSLQLLVCEKGLDSFLQSIGFLISYGDINDKSSTLNLFKMLSKKTVVASCGSLSGLISEILSRLKIKNRIVVLMTKDEWGGQDDGHTLVEIKDKQNGWFLYDPSFNLCFKRNDKRLSVLEFSKLLNTNFKLEMLPGNNNYSKFVNGSHVYDFWIGARFLSKKLLIKWYRRIGSIPLINHNETLYCPKSFVHTEDANRILSRYKILEDKTFMEKFYN